MSVHATMVRKGGTNADHTYPYQSKGFHSRPSSPLIEEIVGISKPRSKLMDFKQVVVAQPAIVNYKDRAKKNRSMMIPSQSFEGLVHTNRLMKPNNYMLMSTNIIPSTVAEPVADSSTQDRDKRTDDKDITKPAINIMSEFVRPPLHNSRHTGGPKLQQQHYNNNYVQQSAPLSPQSDHVEPAKGFFNDDDDDDIVPARHHHIAPVQSVSLDWILELGMQQFKNDHALERNAVKEAAKNAAGGKADFSYAAPLDSHPENFLLERFDKDIAARNDIPASVPVNNNISSSSSSPNVPILGINDNPILKKLNKRDRSLFKRNMEIKVLSRASVLAIVDNRSSSFDSDSRPPLQGWGRSNDGSGFDFYAAAASAAASVGLADIASILSTDDNNFDVLSKFQPLPIDLDSPTSSSPPPHHHHVDTFDDNRAVSPDRMSHTIQRPLLHHLMMPSPHSSGPPRSTHSNDLMTTTDRRDSHLSFGSRPKSTSALIDLDHSHSKQKTDPYHHHHHPQADKDLSTNSYSNNSTADNNNSIIGVRTKLKFEGPYVNSPYVWHMTKEVDKLIVDAPPPGVPMSTTTIKKKRPKTKSAKGSSTSIPSRDPMQQPLQDSKQPTSIDQEPTSAAAMMHVSKSLPSGILAAPAAAIRPVSTSLDLELPSQRQSRPLPEVKPIRSASSSRRFSQDVRQITSSVYSILVPPSGHQTTDLYRPSLEVHRKHSELISENQSSRVLSPGLLDVQPSLMRNNTKLHAISSSSSLHVVPSKPLSIDFLVSSVQGSTSTALMDVPASRDVWRMEHDSMSLDSSSVNGNRGGSLAINLEKAGVLINDLVGDPLYRILQEEIESLYHDSTNSIPSKVTVNPAQQRNDMLILNTTPGSSPYDFASSGDVGKVRKGNSKTGLSNYRTRSLNSTINTSELKILSTFRSLPSGVWFTCRVVYFLVMAYYEYVIRRGKGVVNSNNDDSSPYSNLNALWAVLEKQQVEERVTIDSIENNYSWPLLQLIIEKFPLQFTRLLNIIEFGSSHPSSPPKGGKPPLRISTAGKDDLSSAAVFFNSFPLSNLILLRNIVKQGMWIFQSHALMHTVTVSAQLCDWCKRIMAGIYTSCLVRLRAVQSVGNNAGVSALRSTAYYHSVTHGDASNSSNSGGTSQQQQQPPSNKVLDVFNSSIYGPTMYGMSSVKLQVAHSSATENSRASMPPYFTFVLAVDDAFNAQTFFNFKKTNQQNNSRMQSMLRGSSDQDPSPIKSDIPPSETMSRALSLVKPSDRLDLLLIPPDYRDVDNPLGIASFTANYDESFIVAAVTQLYIIWESISQAYTEHLQHFSSSPMHRVCIVPVEVQSGSKGNQSQHMLSVIRSINSIITSKLAYSYSSSPQDHGMYHHHPVIEHCMQYDRFTEYSPQIQPSLSPSSNHNNNSNNNNNHTEDDAGRLQADILITRLKNGRVPKLLSLNDSTDKSLAMNLKFSLILIDDAAPMVHRPLTSFTAAMREAGDIIEPVIASSAGPNKYVVCITDNFSSWTAFQLTCRLAKPSDTISLVHVPVLRKYDVRSMRKQSSSNGSSEDRFLRYLDYINDYRRAKQRIDQLVSLYRTIGFNIHVDHIPEFSREVSKQIIYRSRDFYYEAVAAELSYEDPLPDYFIANQQTYDTASRLLQIIITLQPDFVVVGGQPHEIESLLLNNSAASNLNFPYDSFTLDNTRDVKRVRSEQAKLDYFFSNSSSVDDRGGDSSSAQLFLPTEYSLYEPMVSSSSSSGYRQQQLQQQQHQPSRHAIIIEEDSRDIREFDIHDPHPQRTGILDFYDHDYFEEDEEDEILFREDRPRDDAVDADGNYGDRMVRLSKEMEQYLYYSRQKLSVSEMLLHQYSSLHGGGDVQQKNINNNINNNNIARFSFIFSNTSTL